MSFTRNEETLFEHQATLSLVINALIATHPNKAELLAELERIREPMIARQLNSPLIGDAAAETSRIALESFIATARATL